MHPRLAQFPEQIDTGHPGAAPLTRAVDCCALLGAASSREALFMLEDEDVAVFRTPPADAPASRLVAVYTDAAGTIAIPTGRVFVRFREGVAAEARRAGIASAGFSLLEVPPYAPHAAWIEAADRDCATTLSNLAALRRLPDVENVEPQLLRHRAQRGAR